MELSQELDELILEVGVKFDNGSFKRNMFIKEDKLEDFRKCYNNRSLHKSSFKYDSRDIENANLYGDFYIDFDSNESFEDVRKDVIKTISFLKITFRINYDDMQFFFSGNKGIHLVISAKVFGINPCKDLPQIFKYIVEEIKGLTKHKTIDTQVYHARAMLRLPHSIHEKTDKYKTEITLQELLEHKDIPELCVEQRNIKKKEYLLNTSAKQSFEEYTKRLHQELKNKKTVNYDSIIEFDPPCIQYLLNNHITQGDRNYTATVIASHFRARGLDNNNAKQLLDDWNNNYCSPKLEKREIITIINSIFRTKKRYGCTTLAKISQCNKECELYRGGSDGKQDK